MDEGNKNVFSKTRSANRQWRGQSIMSLTSRLCCLDEPTLGGWSSMDSADVLAEPGWCHASGRSADSHIQPLDTWGRRPEDDSLLAAISDYRVGPDAATAQGSQLTPGIRSPLPQPISDITGWWHRLPLGPVGRPRVHCWLAPCTHQKSAQK